MTEVMVFTQKSVGTLELYRGASGVLQTLDVLADFRHLKPLI